LGFAAWLRALPVSVQKMVRNPFSGFEQTPNRRLVWKKQETIAGEELVVITVQTAD